MAITIRSQLELKMKYAIAEAIEYGRAQERAKIAREMKVADRLFLEMKRENEKLRERLGKRR
jgi:hypothetical protein